MSEPGFVAETLAWCNERRAEKGKRPLKKLPKGVREDGFSCPCGKATGLYVGLISYGASALESDATLPGSVRTFVDAFDMGELPQYEAKS